MKNDRILWVDALKGIGIILVILGHIYSIYNKVNIWIYSFHMPLFFFISGYLSLNSLKSNKSNKEYLIKKIKTLLIPFIIFEIILYVYWLLIERNFRSFDIGPSWFIITIFFVSNIIYISRRKISQNNLFYIYFVMIFAIIIIIKEMFPQINNTVFIWGLRILIGMIWYLTGIKVKLLLEKTKIKKIINTTGKRWGIFILTLIISIYTSLKNGPVGVFSCVMNNYFLYYIAGITGVISCFIGTYCLFKNNEKITWLGKYSLIILATHEPIKRVLMKIFDIVFSRYGYTFKIFDNSIIAGFILCLVLIFVEFLFITFVRYINKKYNKNEKLKEILFFIN